MANSTLLDSKTMRVYLPQVNTKRRISHATLLRLATKLGLDSAEDVLHYAVLKLSRELSSGYEPDDGALTNAQMAVVRKAGGISGSGKVVSKLF